MYSRVAAWQGHLAGWLFVSFVALLSGFGVWLGRFLRLNSWDVVTGPSALFAQALQPVLHPLEHARAWGVTSPCSLVCFSLCTPPSRPTSVSSNAALADATLADATLADATLVYAAHDERALAR